MYNVLICKPVITKISNNLPLGPHMSLNNWTLQKWAQYLLSWLQVSQNNLVPQLYQYRIKVIFVTYFATRPINDHHINTINDINQVWMCSMEISCNVIPYHTYFQLVQLYDSKEFNTLSNFMQNCNWKNITLFQSFQ